MSYRRGFAAETIKVGSQEISERSPAFIIAEAACNHMCDIELAKRMIDEARAAGADAIKFQTYKAERLVCRNLPAYWKYSSSAKSQFEYYKDLDKFGKDDYNQLFDYGSAKGIIAFSTAFDIESATMLNDLGVSLFKIASCDLLDIRLLRHLAKFNKPIILSTGAGTLEEIEQAVDTIFNSGNPNLILMVCTLSYPASNQDAHLRRILTFKEKFPGMIIGLSDHTPPDENMIIPSIAVALGAKVIEKHYTLNRNMTGSGHAFSIEPKDLKRMVNNIRLTETVLGNNEIKVYEVEQPARQNARRSLVAKRDIKKGERIVDNLLSIKRPGTGLSPDLIEQIIGKIAKSDIKEDTQLTFEQLE